MSDDPIQQALDAARGLVRAGRRREAEQLYGVILKHLPDNREARAELSALQQTPGVASGADERLQTIVSLHGQGRFAEALVHARALQASDPRSAVAANMVGVLSLNIGDRDGAVAAFRAALALEPDFLEAEANLGTLLTEMGRPQEALPHLERVVAAQPKSAGFLTSLANAYAALGGRERAEDLYRAAIAADDRFPPALGNLGALLSASGRRAEAEAFLRQALEIDPRFADAWVNLGHLHVAAGRHALAEAAFFEALAINPGLKSARTGLALLLADTGRAGEAADHYRLAAQSDPSDLDQLARALYFNAMICRWDGAQTDGLARLKSASLIDEIEKAPSPFLLMTLVDDPHAQKRAAQALVQREAARLNPAFPVFATSGADRIRIGYFSADFHEHATMYLIARLFELHDRGRFEVHAFSFGPTDADPMRARLMREVEHFHEIGSITPEAAAAEARALGLDIAVDLKGFTRDSRPRIFLDRAAPIQVNFLGYPGTCGAEAWDYIIADKTIVPAGSEGDYAEKIVFMPDSYQVNDDRRAIAGRRVSRAECGLPEDGFVFCSFNNSYKITPVEFDIWMRLLSQVEGSALWLLGTSSAAERNLRAEAARRVVDPARLVFAPRLPVPEHLARHRLADLFLDTFVVNAHTTASDALWAGLPVLTRPGRSFAARVSASLVKAAGLPELVALCDADYETQALRLAREPTLLAALRQRLCADPARLPLFDAVRYTQKLEAAYREMVAIRRAGEPPRHIVVA